MTKIALGNSLKKHMESVPLNKITVQQIVDDCGMNRNTFYYHFSNVYDLLHWTLEEEAVEVIRNFDMLADCESAIEFVMDYVEQNKHILNCALDSVGREHLKQFFYDDFINLVSGMVSEVEEELNVTLDDSFRDFLCAFYTEAFAGVLCEWIRHYERYDRNETIQYVSFIMKESIPGIIASKDRNQR